ncbi:GNAT family N-acetyltransferase [Actinomyces polynesiensis]|uniref:GNAT family N-acetyltransferase n=1 Tax=Actinomyces polynesiensis TaxID=1325934 RepID=UPI0005BE65E1|nr:GNAT family protein [Actinomyces polynesiensis]
MARVWGRPVQELTLVVNDPVGKGFLRPGPAGGAAPRRLVLRPALGRDHQRIDAVRRRDWKWLGPWEATLPAGSTEDLPDLATFRRRIDRQQRRGEALLMVAELDGEVAGLFSLSGVQRGAMCQGSLGYWVAGGYAHRGLGSLCTAMFIDLVIGELGLHRIEVNVRPENGRSLGLCRKLGLRREGLKVRYMNIAGRWADHVAFAIDAEQLPEGGLVARVWGHAAV